MQEGLTIPFIGQYKLPATQPRRGFPLTAIIGLLAVLVGTAFLLKLIGINLLPFALDDKLLQYAASIFSIIAGLYMIYKSFWRPVIRL